MGAVRKKCANLGRCALIAAAGAAVVLALTGCRGPARPQRAAGAAPARVSPVVRGAGSGLETWWWVVSDARVERRAEAKREGEEGERKPGVERARGPERSALPEDFVSRRVVEEPPEEEEGEEEGAGVREPRYRVVDDKEDLEAVLTPFAYRRVPLPEDVLRRWAESGLRVYAVPQGALPEIERRLRLVAPVQRQWLGEAPGWTDIAAGPWNERGFVVGVAGEPVRVGPGRLRLMARAWTAPLPGPEGVRPGLRLEVVPEHEPVESEQEKLLVAAGLRERERHRGVAFERLSIGATLESDDALVIVPLGRRASEAERVEPFREGDRLLGEAMLLREGTESRARARAVIVLVPRLAARFELLGP
jgi:hypothetical protein